MKCKVNKALSLFLVLSLFFCSMGTVVRAEGGSDPLVSISDIYEGDEIIRGIGKPDAQIEIEFSDGNKIDTVVEADGTWEANIPAEVMLAAGTTVTVTHTVDMDPDGEIVVENLSRNSDLARVGDILQYTTSLWNPEPDTVLEQVYFTHIFMESVELVEESEDVGDRPVLYKNGVELPGYAYGYDDQTKEISLLIDSLPYGDTYEFVYCVKVVGGFNSTILGSAEVIANPEITTLTATVLGTESRTVTKIWDDENDQDGKRPDSINVQLKANGVDYDEPVTLEGDSWTYTWDNLPKKENGQEVVYTVEEITTADGYTTTYSEDTFTITNSHAPETVDVGGTKIWEDMNDQDGKRPEEIKVNLLADNVLVESKTVTADDNWEYQWTGLPKYAAGEEIEYTLTEDPVSGYQTDISGYNITNSYTPETIDVGGIKTWDDADDQDGKRPEEITVNLLADNVLVESKTVTADDNWEYQWTGLPKYADGKVIDYTITENPVSDYGTDIEGYDITNSYTPGKTSRTVVKNWADADDMDGIRPESIQVQLYADGQPLGDEVTLDEANGWMHIWNNLPEKKSGKDIVYTVEEIDTPEDYEVSYSTDGFTITNTYRPQILISKVNTAGSELSGATLTIYEADAAGKATETIAQGKDGDLTWETTGEPHDITGIPAGTYILHEEAAPRGYYVAYDILFTVNADGTVTKDSATGDVDGNTIIMTDLKYGEVMPEWVALVIGKTVTGTAGDQEQEFTFTLELTYEDGEEVTEEFSYDGSRTGIIASGESVKLKHGEYIKIYGIPLGVQYTVTESDNEGYKVTKDNAAGTIDELGRNVQFLNHKDKSDSGDDNNGGKTPQTKNSAVNPKTYTKGSTTIGSRVKTGDTTPLMRYGVLLIVGMGTVGFLLYFKKRKVYRITAKKGK